MNVAALRLLHAPRARQWCWRIFLKLELCKVCNSICIMYSVRPVLVYTVKDSSESLSILGVESARSEHGLLRQLHSTTQWKVSMVCSEGVMCGLHTYKCVAVGDGGACTWRTVCECVSASVCRVSLTSRSLSMKWGDTGRSRYDKCILHGRLSPGPSKAVDGFTLFTVPHCALILFPHLLSLLSPSQPPLTLPASPHPLILSPHLQILPLIFSFSTLTLFSSVYTHTLSSSPLILSFSPHPLILPSPSHPPLTQSLPSIIRWHHLSFFLSAISKVLNNNGLDYLWLDDLYWSSDLGEPHSLGSSYRDIGQILSNSQHIHSNHYLSKNFQFAAVGIQTSPAKYTLTTKGQWGQGSVGSGFSVFCVHSSQCTFGHSNLTFQDPWIFCPQECAMYAKKELWRTQTTDCVLSLVPYSYTECNIFVASVVCMYLHNAFLKSMGLIYN